MSRRRCHNSSRYRAAAATAVQIRSKLQLERASEVEVQTQVTCSQVDSYHFEFLRAVITFEDEVLKN